MRVNPDGSVTLDPGETVTWRSEAWVASCAALQIAVGFASAGDAYAYLSACHPGGSLPQHAYEHRIGARHRVLMNKLHFGFGILSPLRVKPDWDDTGIRWDRDCW